MAWVNSVHTIPGNFVDSDWRTERSDGVVYDVASGTMVPLHRIDGIYAVTVGLSKKPPIFKWDHHSASDYGRGVSEVTDDSPIVYHHHYDNPTDHLTSNYDYHSTEYISKLHTPFSISYVLPGLSDQAWSKATTDALNSLNGVDVQWGNDLGEMKESVESLARDAMRGASFIKHMRHGRWTQAANALGITPGRFKADRGRALADHWLNYSYGWRPLARNIYDTAHTFYEMAHNAAKLIEGNGNCRVSGSPSYTSPYSLAYQIQWLQNVHCVLRAVVENPNLHRLNQLGLTNPVSIAWELVPFSFVIDWFIPVSNVLSAMSAGFGLSWRGGQINVNTYEQINIHREPGYITPWTDCVGSGSYTEKTKTMQRVALTGFPYPRFYADLTPYSTTRALNAAALVRNCLQ